MFDFFRNNIKFLMGFLMLLIIPSFVLFGVEGYKDMGDKGAVVAKVGKADITQEQWDAAHRSEIERMVARMPNLDRATLDQPAPRMATLERLVNDQVLLQTVQDDRILVTDQRLASELLQDPNIATLRNADGALDVQRYQDILRSQGMTPEQFEASVRTDMARRQVLAGVTASAFASTAVAQTALNAVFERREIQFAAFVPKDFLGAAKVSDEDVQKYYDEHKVRFQSPEQADVEYVVLDLPAVVKRITLNESDVRTYFEQNNAALAQKQEQRRASHILLTVDAKASAEDKAKVKAQAQKLLDELRQAPARFAELAKARSQDPGSAAKGGDLDFFARGAMVKPFEDAVFALNKGQLSDLVESEFGYHIIVLTDIRRPALPSFETARPKLEEELKRQQAQRQFAEASETFSNMVYEQADSLQPVADKLGLTIQTEKAVLRSAPAQAKPDDVWAQARLREAVFADDAVRQKHNTAALEVGTNRLVSARVVAYRPAALRPLEEVKAEVRDRLLQEKALALAQAEGKAKLAAWQAKPDSAALRPALTVARNQAMGLPVSLLKAAFAAPAGPQTPAWTSVDLGSEGFVVVRVNRVLDRNPPSAEQKQQEFEQIQQLLAQAEAKAYLGALREHRKTQILVKNLEEKR